MEDQSTELYLSGVQRLEIKTDMLTPFRTTYNYKRSYCSLTTHTRLAQTQVQTTHTHTHLTGPQHSRKNLIFHWKFVVHCMPRHLINFSTYCLAALLTAARVYVLFLSSSN